MKNIKTNLTKKIISIIILIMLCNFIMPNLSFAVSANGGGSFIGGIAQLFCFLPDAIVGALQYMFVNGESIQAENGEYQIMYSPGVIFSGQIPAFDIDFINPAQSRTGTKTTKQYWSLIEALEKYGAVQEKSESYWTFNDSIIEDIKEDDQYEYDENDEIDISQFSEESRVTKENEDGNIITNTLECVWYNSDKTKLYIIVNYHFLVPVGSTQTSHGEVILYEMSSEETLNNAMNTAGKEIKVVEEIEYKSSAAILQNIIATWYNALKRIALVGLLSVLVYVGIKIVQSSNSAKNKAKYKGMLKDWLIALCILFTLHYVMSITITVVDKLCDVFKASTIGASGQDVLMSSVRNKIANSENWASAFTYVIIYDTLIVYTVIYTVQYIRRVIHIGFLTTIAPLITLTYPLDKIKDGKSQAFDMWLKDYIFFVLLQVVHLLIYYIFLGSAIDLNEEGNWLFAIVAITFITVAEKFVKKMFGFEKAKSINAVAAGATGALVNNLMNSLPLTSAIKKKNNKKITKQQNKPKSIRTATVNPLDILTGDGAQSMFADFGDLFEGGRSSGSDSDSPKNNILKNIINLGSNGISPTFIKGAKTIVGKFALSVPKEALKFIVQGNFALLGAATGLANNNFSKGFIAGKSGMKAGGNIVENVLYGFETVKEKGQPIGEKIVAKMQGDQNAKNDKFDKRFRRSNAYNRLKKKVGMDDKDFDAKIQQMLEAGITNPKQMERILEKNKNNPTKYNMENAMAFSRLASMCSPKILQDDVSFIRFCQDKDLNIAEEVLKAIRESVFEFK